MGWLKKISQKSSQIVVKIDNYYKKMSEYITELQQRTQDRQEELKGMQLNSQLVLSGFAGYPDIQNLQAAIQANNFEALEDMLMPLRQYITNFGYKENQQQRDAAYNSFMHLRNFLDSKDPYSYTEQDAQKQIQEVFQKTQQNMQRLSAEIQSAISRIANWNGSPIFIVPTDPYDETGRISYLIPSEDAVITVGTETEDMAPSFEVFVQDGKITIPPEGVIEDDDFFRNPNYTRDYFNLIQEIRSPGSGSKPGKLLKLYTSRPRQDRQFYMSSPDSVPGGIWLTTSENNATDEGFEAGGKRDLWKIIIEDKYVSQKLNVPAYKHYEIIGRDRVPVKKMEFLGEI